MLGTSKGTSKTSYKTSYAKCVVMGVEMMRVHEIRCCCKYNSPSNKNAGFVWLSKFIIRIINLQQLQQSLNKVASLSKF